MSGDKTKPKDKYDKMIEAEEAMGVIENVRQMVHEERKRELQSHEK